jgi:uncharacterized metal-binding protein
MNTTSPKCSSQCNADASPPALVYPCSGAADVGEIADRAARRLSADGTARMSCLAGVGARVSGLVASAAGASALLAIDGCPQDCARKTLAMAGFPAIKHVRVTDLGFSKGQSPADAAAVARVVQAAVVALQS